MLGRNRFHPRNIYKNPPNFKELAIEYPEFRKYVRQELSGRFTIDYQDQKAVKELTKTLLKKDFNLDVDIDDRRLIPRVPLCLNYILWIDDLINLTQPESEIVGIDIGTGNVCIYCLLAARRGWKMLATEMDSENFKCAQNNVIKNNLTNAISLKLSSNSDKLLTGLLEEDKKYDFCMCNPPFYDYSEKPVNRTQRRLLLKSVASDVPTEIQTKGGEISFIQKLIEESVQLRNQIKIFTTLVGKKCDFLQLKKELLKFQPKSMTFTEFCQGKTIRWGMAWTFLDINLKNLEQKKSNKRKSKNPLLFDLPNHESGSLKEVLEKVKKILSKLEISFKEEFTNSIPALTFKAVKNTWSHQRRKKRLEARTKDDSNEGDKNPVPDHDEHFLPVKKPKSESENQASSNSNNPAVEGFITVKLDESLSYEPPIAIEMSWLSGNKESLHQIFQFFKNNWSDSVT